MTDTEIQLFVLFKSATIRLDLIAEDYFGLSVKTANDRALTNKLPIPAFRLGTSQKAPWMVSVTDLAAHIDNAKQSAAELWEKSQV